MTDFTGRERKAGLAHLDAASVAENQIRSRALEAIRQGDLEGARRVVDTDHGRSLTLEQVFRLYQTELENQAQQLRDSQAQAQQAMEWSQNLFRSLPVSAVLVDGVGTVVDANQHAQDELEILHRSQAQHWPLRRLMATVDDELRLAATLSACRGGVPQALNDVALCTPSGRRRIADLRLTRLPDDIEAAGVARDQAARFLCVFNDRTARVEAERASELTQAAEHQRDIAQSANEAKTQLLSRVSHELRTPLNAVLGFSQLLLVSPEALAPDSLARVRQIQRAGTHLLSLVDEVLEINQAEAGQLHVGHEPVSLLASAREVLSLQQPVADLQSVQLQIAESPASDEPVLAWADPRRVREVLANLISNAIKYNVAGGRVDVRLGQADGRAWIEVADTGIGMSAVQLQHLYEPFNRLGAEQLSIQGHGLGLSISRALVQAMQGRLSIQASPGLGTTCRVELPTPPTAG